MNRTILFFVFTVLLSFIVINGLGSKTVYAQSNTANRFLILTDDFDEHFLSPYLYQYETKPNDTVYNLQIRPRLPIIKDETPYKVVNISATKNVTWFGFDIQNRSTKQEWAISTGNTAQGLFGLFSKVQIFTQDEETGIITTPPIQSDNDSYVFTIDTPHKTKIFIKLQSDTALPKMVPLKLMKLNKAEQNNTPLFIYLIVLFCVGMGFFFAAIAFMQSSKSYLIFSMYYLVPTFIIILQNHFYSITLFFSGQILTLLYCVWAVMALLTTKIFWNITQHDKYISWVFYALSALTLISTAVGLFFINNNFILQIALVYTPLMSALAFATIISFFYSQNRTNETISFTLGWLILLVGAIISSLPFFGIMPPISSALNAYWFALLPQAFFFIIAIKDKITSLNEDTVSSKFMQLNETDSISRLRESRENKEQERLLKVIEQERKVLTELRKSEAKRTDEMRKSKDLADQANKAKSAFLAIVTHEIRTPMTGIMGMVRLLLESNLSKEQKNYAQTIQDSSDSMLALLNDILDFEKIEQGKMTFETITYDLHRVINGVATLMKGHATQKKIDLITKLGDNVPQFVKGDPTRLRQVLLNLTGNAVKFTEKGHVTITAERIDNNDLEKENMCEIYFSIIDSGIGISRDVQQNLFTPFSQANNSIARKFGGTGLGLAICKGLVQAMGSEINISSNEGEGSTFFFILKMPIGNLDQTVDINRPEKIESKQQTKSQNILVVDDNEINLNVVHGLLANYPHKIKTLDTAEKAIEITKKEKFDLILMDIELPGIKGDEATEKIRKDSESLNKDTPIIALTGNLMPQHIERYKKVKMNAVLEKPIDPEKLIQYVNGQYDNAFEEMARKPVEKKKPIINSTPTKIVQNQKPEMSNGKEEQELSTDIDHEILNTLKIHLKFKDIREMLNDVITKSNELVNSIVSLHASNDLKSITDRCHELRGMAGNFGIVELSQQAHKIEKSIRENEIKHLENDIKTLTIKEKRAAEALQTWLDNNQEDY